MKTEQVLKSFEQRFPKHKKRLDYLKELHHHLLKDGLGSGEVVEMYGYLRALEDLELITRVEFRALYSYYTL